MIPASSIDFLKKLKDNNNRDWFNAHKDEYLEQLAYIEAFADALLGEMNKHDVIETVSGKKSLQRIYRDTRFSPDKTPYKTNWSGGFTRATAQRRGGYYFHIEPGNTFVAGGFWAPEPRDMKLIRDDISFDPAPIRRIISSKEFTDTFGSLRGEQLKTTPKGFDPTDEAIDLLRYKQFLLQRKFTDKEVLSPGFVEQANLTYMRMRPFFDYMSEILTSNADGSVAD
ncbi:DUF2461 domain-containing protein [Dyadobacter sp. Leaf189]|uniref:DUF2461 domain-containing protein n=1 Tax=Dyadobacter sp. Leaf189 TaxID=1736295 RepID=UPI0006F3CBA8|nr:DUF2461 domain-containing protein [Dyadobacter sp. Leaf189]KQS28373.1 hypothetical protein ASG33_16340 [Dyadobacter sp. Leaf189]